MHLEGEEFPDHPLTLVHSMNLTHHHWCQPWLHGWGNALQIFTPSFCRVLFKTNSPWITHSYSAMFLCYGRGYICIHILWNSIAHMCMVPPSSIYFFSHTSTPLAESWIYFYNVHIYHLSFSACFSFGLWKLCWVKVYFIW